MSPRLTATTVAVPDFHVVVVTETVVVVVGTVVDVVVDVVVVLVLVGVPGTVVVGTGTAFLQYLLG